MRVRGVRSNQVRQAWEPACERAPAYVRARAVRPYLRRMTRGVVAGMAVRDLALHGPLSLWEFDSTTNF